MVNPMYHSPLHWESVFAAVQGPTAVLGSVRAALRASVLAQLARVQTGGVVLEVACGNDSILAELRADLSGIATDFSAGAISAARAIARRRLSWLRADAGKLPFADCTVDAAVCVCGLWTFAAPQMAIVELARVLRPGGLLVLQVWDSAAACELVTIGGAALARVTPTVVRPVDVRGPFDVTSVQAAAWVGAAGCLSVRIERYEYSVAPANAEGYWAEFGGVAHTAHAIYCRLLPEQQEAADRLVAGVLRRRQEAAIGKPAVIGLAWRLVLGRR
jgi:SAM-dependent methyltransferase